jgi:hypothetical protein
MPAQSAGILAADPASRWTREGFPSVTPLTLLSFKRSKVTPHEKLLPSLTVAVKFHENRYRSGEHRPRELPAANTSM